MLLRLEVQQAAVAGIGSLTVIGRGERGFRSNRASGRAALPQSMDGGGACVGHLVERSVNLGL